MVRPRDDLITDTKVVLVRLNYSVLLMKLGCTRTCVGAGRHSVLFLSLAASD